MTLKLGLLGAGRIGLTHARAVSALDGAAIAAVHDLLPEAAARAEACVGVVEASGIPFMLGFNRRFDPSFAALKAQLDEGAIGKPELVQINSRDPAPPPLDYARPAAPPLRCFM